MSSISCVNCGASLNSDTSAKYIKCEYCKSLNSNFSAFNNIEALLTASDTGDDVYKDLQLSYKLQDYPSVKGICEKLLGKTPNSWIALTYLSIAEFWLGYDDFDHLDRIHKYLEKAKLISNNNELPVDAANKIANNIIVLGAKNKTYGDDLKNAISAFKIAHKLSSIDAESEECLLKYVNQAFDYQKNNLDSLITKNKKDYDPPYISLMNVYELMCLSNRKDISEYFYLHSKIHLSKGQTKSYFNDLLKKTKDTESKLRTMGSDVVGKSLSFNFMGKLIIK